MLNRTSAESDYHLLSNRSGADFNYFLKKAKNIGFDYCATGVQLPLPVSAPKTVLENNYPSAWRSQYERENFLLIDPVIPYTLSKPGPILWSETHQWSQAFWEEASYHNLKYGISIAMRHCSGALGMFSIARSHNDIKTNEFNIISSEIERMAGIFAFSEFAKTVENSLPEATVELTKREKEVLRWTADGKTSEDIAKILSLSVNTVNFHIKQTQAKLNAVNKTQAVVKALMLRLM